MSLTSRVHGLIVQSDFDFGLPVSENLSPSVCIRLGEFTSAERGPGAGGEILADLSNPAGHVFYSFWRLADHSFFLRWPGLMDVEVNAAADQAVIHPCAGADHGLVEVIAKGALLAFILTVRGHANLHASCVAHHGVAVAFVGASGMGKSTLATLACQSGASMMTDDVLRVDPSDEELRAFRGVAETRLRAAAQQLAMQFDDTARRRTADGRNAIRLALAEEDDLPLHLVAIPSPQRDATVMTVERLDMPRALLLLSQFPRFPGWRGADGLRLQFESLAALVSRVPVVILRVPWGPPFRPLDLAEVMELTSVIQPA